MDKKSKEKKYPFNKNQFFAGIHDAVPILLGYLAVGFTLGIAAKNAGLTPFQAFIASFFNNASAGEYAGFTLIKAGATLVELAMVTLVINARYLLMSCALSQKLPGDVPMWQRILIGFDITDEVFGISISRPVELNPWFTIGAICAALPGWAFGTMFGVIIGGVLPNMILDALSVALYGMFIAIIIPPARKNRVVSVLIIISFAASWAATKIPFISGISEGMRIFILTVIIAGVAAILFPIREDANEN